MLYLPQTIVLPLYLGLYSHPLTYWFLVGNGWEWMGMGVAGIMIDSYCGSFPHFLLSTSKSTIIPYIRPIVQA